MTTSRPAGTDDPARDDGTTSALLRLDQPWTDASLARLYDVFPFDADVGMYRDLAAAEGGTVLEVGCGSGRVLLPLVRAGHRVVGVDASPHMLPLAAEKLDAEPEGVRERARLERADMRSFDLDEQADLAIVPVKTFAYLTSRADQQRTLARIAAHVPPGGLLVLDLLHPTPSWLARPDGSLHQDLVEHVEGDGTVVARTETVVRTDLADQLRIMRSAYEVIGADGVLRKRIVEWPYRFTYRFEAEHLVERAGFEIEAVHGGYPREPFTSESPMFLVVARRR